jgi:hypothetical protein
VSILANEIKDPSPEKDIDELNNKQEKETRNAHLHSSQLKGIHVAGNILEGNNDQSNDGNKEI